MHNHNLLGSRIYNRAPFYVKTSKMNINIFQYDDYRLFLKDSLQKLKEKDSEKTYGDFANFCGIQSSFLSKTFRGDSDLNPDQIFLACKYLDLNEASSDFLMLLLEYSRAQVDERKQFLHKRIDVLQKQYRQTKKFLKLDSLQAEEQAKQEYFLNPELQLIYTALTIRKYQKAPQLILEFLDIPLSQLDSYLEKLERFSLISKKDDDSWETSQTFFHITAENPLFKPYQSLLKQRCLQRLNRLEASHAYNFVSTVTMDEKTKKRVQDEFLLFLNKVNSWVLGAPSEKMYQMNFELFPWEN